MNKMEYTHLMTHWIHSCIDAESIEKIKANIRSDKPIGDIIEGRAPRAPESINYFRRVLTEEVTKQFPHQYKPIVELIENSRDAKPESVQGKDYHISVELDTKKVTVKDDGVSLSLEEILEYLIIPFSTKKKEGSENMYLGRFGIGFFSALSSCVKDGATLEVQTSKGDDYYSLLFSCQEKNVKNLKMRLKKTRPRKQGTIVSITNTIIDGAYKFDPDNLEKYLRNEVGSTPGIRADITFNGEKINTDAGYWYEGPVRLKGSENKELEQTVGLSFRDDDSIVLTNMGTTVTTSASQCANDGLTIFFPAGVAWTKGKEGFVKNRNYRAACLAVLELYESAIKDKNNPIIKKHQKVPIEIFREMLPALAASLDLTYDDIPNIDGLCSFLMPEKKYVVLHAQFDTLRGFLPDTKNVFVTTPASLTFYSKGYKGFREMVSDNSTSIANLAYDEFVGHMETDTGFCPNLRSLFQEAGKTQNRYLPALGEIEKVHLLRCKHTLNPFMHDAIDKTLYINLSDMGLDGGFNSLKVNYAFSRYVQLTRNKPGIAMINFTGHMKGR